MSLGWHGMCLSSSHPRYFHRYRCSRECAGSWDFSVWPAQLKLLLLLAGGAMLALDNLQLWLVSVTPWARLWFSLLEAVLMWRWIVLGDWRVRAHTIQKKTWKHADSAGKCPGSYKQTTLCLPVFLCIEGYFKKQISSVQSTQHFPQGWGKGKVNGGVKPAWTSPSHLGKECPRKKTKRQDWKPLLDCFCHSSSWSQKIRSTWRLLPEVCCACLKALAVLRQSAVVEANIQVSVLTLKQEQAHT